MLSWQGSIRWEKVINRRGCEMSRGREEMMLGEEGGLHQEEMLHPARRLG